MPGDADLIYFNGVNATRGEYARGPLTVGRLAAMIVGDGPGPGRVEPDEAQRALLRHRAEAAGAFRVKEGVREDDLASAGWAVVFPAAADYAAAREALALLLALRRSQAGDLFRECSGAAGYQAGESARDFLGRQGAATSGAVDPARFPYYVLLVGSPDEIPFRFQYQLDVQYAVGRLHLPAPDAYASYARSVVAAERGEVTLPRRAVFFAPNNPDDRATAASARELAAPLAAALAGEERARGWEIVTVQGEAATKARLAALLGGPETPALLFTASHGAEFDPLDPRQLAHQGAILCQDWPGPRAWAHRALSPDFYLAGEDIGAEARLLGTVTFHFACFGAGTPRLDDFPHLRGQQGALAPHSFVAELPRRLLGHPRGGALAVVGHVERAWTYSFGDGQGGRQLETFASFLRRVMLAGAPVGLALEFFNDRYAELATGLTDDMERLRYGGSVDERQLGSRWTEHNDARSYVVLGDPAARLPLPRPGAAADATRATIPEVRTVSTPRPEPPAQATAPPPHPGGPPPPAPQAAPPGYPYPGYPPPPVVVYYSYGPPPGQAGAPPPGAAGESYGVREWLSRGGEVASETAQKLGQALQGFAEQLAATLEQTLRDASDLHVETYVAEDLSGVDYRAGDFSKAELRAVTLMELDGDTKVLVPRSDAGVDQELWAVHTSMVAQAQANRAEMIRAIAQAASGLFAAVQGK